MSTKAKNAENISYSVPLPTCPEKREYSEGRILWSKAAGTLFFTIASQIVAYFAVKSQFGFQKFNVTSVDNLGAFLPIFLVGLFTMLAFQYLHGLYRSEAILQRRTSERSLVCVIGWTLLFSTLALFVETSPRISPAYPITAGIIMASVLPIWELWFRQKVIETEVGEAFSKKVVVIGWNDDAGRLYRYLKNVAAFKPYRMIAHLPHGDVDQANFKSDVSELNSIDEVTNLVETGRADAVMVADYDMQSAKLLELHRLCGREVVDFMLLPPSLGVLRSGLRMQMVGSTPLLVDDNLPLQEPVNQAIKRAIDIVGACVGLVAFAPIMLLFCLMVYRESPGPVFYKQVRVGKKRKTFEIIKIRSMRLDAEKDDKVGWTQENDNRRLKVGEFMRKYNIDELPQFWNVIKGEMSLVGPRPERPELIQNFKHDIEHYNFRHFVKPGLTGWAQVNGWRGDTCLQKRIHCDLEYMERWSLWLDLYIMLLTLAARKNAY